MMKTFLLTFVLAVMAMGQSAEKELLAAHEAYMAAARAGDTAPLEKLFAEGLQYSHSNGKLENKREAIDNIAKGKPNFKLHDQSVVMHGNMATIRAKITSINPKTGDMILTVLQVWVKKGSQWQLAQRQTTRIPQS